MPIPASGPISMSMLNVELGRASNAANSALAGASTPSVGSLFWLGAQSGSLNQTAPHQISEWYGYTAGPPIVVPQPFLEYDPYKNNYDGSTAVNIGTGGTTYNLTQVGGIVTGSSGTGAYYRINDGSTSQYFVDYTSVNISASSFTVSMMFYPIGITTGSPFLSLYENNPLTIDGFDIILNEKNSNEIESLMWKTSVSSSILRAPITRNTWNHLAITFNYAPTTKTGSLYINNSLVSTAYSTANQLPSGTVYQMGIGTDPLLGSPYTSSMRLGNLSYWTSSLTSAEIGALYSEFTSRY